jgi:hypothetical protein
VIGGLCFGVNFLLAQNAFFFLFLDKKKETKKNQDAAIPTRLSALSKKI